MNPERIPEQAIEYEETPEFSWRLLAKDLLGIASGMGIGAASYLKINELQPVTPEVGIALMLGGTALGLVTERLILDRPLRQAIWEHKTKIGLVAASALIGLFGEEALGSFAHLDNLVSDPIMTQMGLDLLGLEMGTSVGMKIVRF